MKLRVQIVVLKVHVEVIRCYGYGVVVVVVVVLLMLLVSLVFEQQKLLSLLFHEPFSVFVYVVVHIW